MRTTWVLGRLALLGGLTWVGTPHVAWAAPEAKTLTGKAVLLESPPPTQLARVGRPHLLGEAIRLGTAEFAVVRKGTATWVAAVPGAAATTPVGAGKSATLTWNDGEVAHKRRLGFVAAGDGGLAWFAADAWRYRLGDATLTLIDGDADGCYGSVSEDAWVLGEGGFALPHVPVAVIGSQEVSFEEIAEDGSRLRVRTADVKGTEPQLAGLAVVNRARVGSGLLPLTLDEKQSHACTLHARYLRANRWTGYTDPHFEDKAAPGYTSEGSLAAKRSSISGNAPAVGVRQCWLTWYHRLDFLMPRVESVGIADAADLTVFDLSGTPGRAGSEAGHPEWGAPIFSPPDGAVGVPVAFAPAGERPDEPVPDAGRRGFPLLLVDPGASHVTLTEFRLENLNGKKPVDIPATIGDPRHWPHAAGAVPDAPLERASRYRATFTYARGGTSTTARVVFETEK